MAQVKTTLMTVITGKKLSAIPVRFLRGKITIY